MKKAYAELHAVGVTIKAPLMAEIMVKTQLVDALNERDKHLIRQLSVLKAIISIPRMYSEFKLAKERKN